MDDFTASPLFVVGAPRSGTSLIRNLIRSCKGVYMPPDETQFFPAYLEKVSRGATTESLAAFLNKTAFSAHMRTRGLWPTRAELLDIFSDPAPASAIPRLMQYLAGRENRAPFTVWGDKTPKYVYFLEAFGSVFPNMRVIFAIRDPRDAALSMHDAWGRSLIRGAVAWRDAARIAHDVVRTYGPARAIALRYEALATEPVKVMAGVAQWLGVDFSDDSVESYAGEERWGAVRNTGIASTSVGRYRAGLSTREVAIVEGIAFAEMETWGYVPDFATEPHIPSSARLQWARMSDGVRSLWRYVKDRGVAAGISYKLRQLFVTRGSSR